MTFEEEFPSLKGIGTPYPSGMEYTLSELQIMQYFVDRKRLKDIIYDMAGKHEMGDDTADRIVERLKL